MNLKLLIFLIVSKISKSQVFFILLLFHYTESWLMMMKKQKNILDAQSKSPDSPSGLFLLNDMPSQFLCRYLYIDWVWELATELEQMEREVRR